jgi:hypothetical protein
MEACLKLCGKVWKKVEESGKLSLYLRLDSVKEKFNKL